MLLLWSFFLFFYGIHQGDLYRTEGLRAIVGAEMYRSGDLVVPRLYGEPILTKPPLFYWCIAFTGTIFGEVTTWSARLPAALAGCLAVVIAFLTMRRYFGPMVGFLSGLATPCSFLWLDKGSSAEIDTVLVMWVLGAWACFLRVLEMRPDDHQQFGWWLATLLCVSGGVLTKWTGFLFLYVMAIPLLICQRQFLILFRWPHLLAAVLGACLVWVWLGAVIFQLGPESVWQALWKEGSPRLLHGRNASQHLLVETLVHPFKVMAICLPWSIFALIGIVQSIRSKMPDVGLEGSRKIKQTIVTRSLLCWALAGTLMMTIFPDHNTRQSFALVPAWTLLGVLTWQRWVLSTTEVLASRRKRCVGLVLCGTAIWLIVKVVYVELAIPARFRERPALAQQADAMHQFIPDGTTLYLRQVKDECLMFNYGRRVQRLASWDQLESLSWASAPSDYYCILTPHERQAWQPARIGRIVREQSLLDAQGDPLVLVQVRAASIPYQDAKSGPITFR